MAATSQSTAVSQTGRLKLTVDSLDLLADLSPESVALIVTSRPVAQLRQKSYVNESQDAYGAWLLEFGRRSLPIPTFALDVGTHQ